VVFDAAPVFERPRLPLVRIPISERLPAPFLSMVAASRALQAGARTYPHVAKEMNVNVGYLRMVAAHAWDVRGDLKRVARRRLWLGPEKFCIRSVRSRISVDPTFMLWLNRLLREIAPASSGLRGGLPQSDLRARRSWTLGSTVCWRTIALEVDVPS
jgi:hypothetical protein